MLKAASPPLQASDKWEEVRRERERKRERERERKGEGGRDRVNAFCTVCM